MSGSFRASAKHIEMANKEKIDYLLSEIRELEKLVAGMRDAEIYPASFFNQAFQLTHKMLKELHTLEELQIEALRIQMEEHQRLIESIPISIPFEKPEIRQETVTRLESETPEAVIDTMEPESPIEPLCLDKEEKQEREEEIQREVEVKTEVEVIGNEPEEITEETEEIAEETMIVNEEPMVKNVEPIIPDSHEPEIPHTIIRTDKSSVSLNDLLEKKNLSDFRKAFSLNDRFRFRRELFGGNEERMNKAIADLNDIHSYEESVVYLNTILNWNIEDASVADFIKLLEKRFS